MDWLRMPLTILESFWARLPQLQAEQNLSLTGHAMIGAGTMKADDARDHLRRWQRVARVKSPVRKLSEEDKLHELANLGVTIG